MFSLDEINLIYTGSSQDEYWSLGHLYQYIVPNYGYSQKRSFYKLNNLMKNIFINENSEAYVNFIKILNGFSEEERENFLMFVTGASRLPLGGYFFLFYLKLNRCFRIQNFKSETHNC